jgi:transposase-like protein
MQGVFGSECPQCGAYLIAPEWSKHVSDQCIRNVWSCDSCERRFEDLVFLPIGKCIQAHPDGALAPAHFLWHAT